MEAGHEELARLGMATLVHYLVDLAREETVAARAKETDELQVEHQRLHAGVESVVDQGSHPEDPTEAHPVAVEDMTGFVVAHTVAAVPDLLEIAAGAADRVEVVTLVEEDGSDAGNLARE